MFFFDKKSFTLQENVLCGRLRVLTVKTEGRPETKQWEIFLRVKKFRER